MAAVKDISVLVVDDDRFFRQGLEDELARMDGIRVIARADVLEEALGQDVRPDVVLLDLGLPGSCRRIATGDVLARWPSAQVLVITAYASGPDVVLAFAEGDRGYLAKTVDPGELLDALRAVAFGRSYVTPTLAGHLLGARLHLTPAERAVLRHVAEGLTDKQVAATLGISPKAASVRLKAGLAEGSRSAIARFAIDADPFCQLSPAEHLAEESRRRGRLRRLIADRRSRRRPPEVPPRGRSPPSRRTGRRVGDETHLPGRPHVAVSTTATAICDCADGVSAPPVVVSCMQL